MKERKYSVGRFIGIIGIGIIAFVIGSGLVGAIVNGKGQDSQSSPDGLVMTRGTLMAYCKPEALKQSTAEFVVTDAMAETYCGCIYENGTAQFGKEGLTKELSNLGNTNAFTPAMNELVNVCATKMAEAL